MEYNVKILKFVMVINKSLLKTWDQGSCFIILGYIRLLFYLWFHLNFREVFVYIVTCCYFFIQIHCYK